MLVRIHRICNYHCLKIIVYYMYYYKGSTSSSPTKFTTCSMANSHYYAGSKFMLPKLKSEYLGALYLDTKFSIRCYHM